MVEKQLPEEVKAQQVQTTQQLVYNEFRTAGREATLDRANDIIRRNAAPARVLTTLNVGGTEIPLVRKNNLAGFINEREAWRALAKGEPIFVIAYEQTGGEGKKFKSRNYVAVAASTNIKNEKGEIDQGKVEAEAKRLLEERFTSGASGFQRVDSKKPGGQQAAEIYLVNSMYDCTSIVNATLKAGGIKPVNPNVGITVNEAMQNPGHTVIETYETLRKPGENNIGKFFDKAHAGDVVVFLEKQDPEEAKDWEKMTGDKAIWHDGVPYRVGHIALYLGKSEEGEPIIAQAHIYSGTIVKESATYYIKNYVHDAAVIISQDSMAPRIEVASTTNETKVKG